MRKSRSEIVYISVKPHNLKEALEGIMIQCCVSFLNSRRQQILDKRGCKMVIYANDSIGYHINGFGFYEFQFLETIFDFLSPLGSIFAKGIALDVGANVGNHSLYFSRYFSEVHAFEPHPLTSQILRINANQKGNVIVHPYGLGDKSGDCYLAESPCNLGASRIVDGNNTGLRILVKRMDDLEIDRQKIALIKLDVEGFEARVLRGGNEVLRNSRPVVLFETYAEDFSKEMEEVKILRALDYRFAWVDLDRGRLQRVLKGLAMGVRRRRIHKILTGTAIPPANHPMVIAVPPKWQHLLGSSDTR